MEGDRMANRKEVLFKLINNFGINLKKVKEEFSSRFRVQKYVFLLQFGLGYNFNYAYNLYISGPYSPELMQEAYDLAESRDMVKDASFSPADLSFLKIIQGNGLTQKKISNDIEKIKNLCQDNDELLEALTTLLYIARHYLGKGSPEPYTLKRFPDVKPFIDNEIRDKAWKLLKDNNFIN